MDAAPSFAHDTIHTATELSFYDLEDNNWFVTQTEVLITLHTLTTVHSRLQAQQQVRQPGFACSRQVGVQAAALLPQVQLTGFSQRVTDFVVLRDQLLTGGQSLVALRRETSAVSSQQSLKRVGYE